MQRLPLKLLEPGMIVARQVLNEKGTVLVSENTELTEKLIARLENMGVAKVAVKGYPVKLPGFTPRPLREKLRDLEIGFSRADPDNELMRKLRVLVKAHFLRKDLEMHDTNQDTGPASDSYAASPKPEASLDGSTTP